MQNTEQSDEQVIGRLVQAGREHGEESAAPVVEAKSKPVKTTQQGQMSPTNDNDIIKRLARSHHEDGQVEQAPAVMSKSVPKRPGGSSK